MYVAYDSIERYPSRSSGHKRSCLDFLELTGISSVSLATLTVLNT